MHVTTFADLVLLLAVAVPASLLMKRLKLPAIAGPRRRRRAQDQQRQDQV